VAAVVVEDLIAEVLGLSTGVPVARFSSDDSSRLLAMEGELHKRIIGQEAAIKVLAQAIRRTRAGLKDPKRPGGSFIFAGPTGVGKTELAKALAEFLFGDEDALISLDMSEYGEKHTVARLFGAPPGYVGFEEGGQLTEKVRRKPFSVVLFDEVEKAHPDIFNSLLQILEDGKLTDAQGREVNFKNTIIIMTTNLGADAISKRQATGFSVVTEGGQTYDEMVVPAYPHRVLTATGEEDEKSRRSCSHRRLRLVKQGDCSSPRAARLDSKNSNDGSWFHDARM
jgi:ATP-dependent Clp protease ATP-binding subunit ClpC